MANTGLLSTSELDFSTLKSNLKTFLKSQDKFSDYDFDGSNINVLLDVLSYNTYMNAFYLNMVGSEMFLDTAQLRESVVSHAKELNYLPRSATSARAFVDITISPSGTPSTITIPKYYKFTTAVDGAALNFSTDSNHVITPVNGVYTAANVAIYEGQIVTEYFNTSDTPRYIMQSENVDTNSIEVTIVTPTNGNSIWTRETNLYGVGSTSNVYFIQGYSTNQYELVFGDGITGRNLDAGNVVKVIYRDTIGIKGNGAYIFSKSAPIEGYSSISAVTQGVASEGSDRESIDSIKFNAPKFFTTQERGVTAQDFVNLTKQKFPQIQSVNAFGGEELVPPRYGKVVISVKPYGIAGTISNAVKSEIISYLTLKSLTTEPIILDPDYNYIKVDSDVFYDSVNSVNSVNQVKANIVSSILSYATTNLTEFGSDLRFSKLSKVIDSADDSIVSHNTKIKMIKRWSPKVQITNSITFSFANELEHETILYALPNGHNLVFTSSTFGYLHSDGNIFTAFIGDDGLGTVKVYTNLLVNGVLTRTALAENIGTVNYYTGEVTITTIIDSYIGTYISLYATTLNTDIITSTNKFLLIDNKDISINMYSST